MAEFITRGQLHDLTTPARSRPTHPLRPLAPSGPHAVLSALGAVPVAHARHTAPWIGPPGLTVLPVQPTQRLLAVEKPLPGGHAPGMHAVRPGLATEPAAQAAQREAPAAPPGDVVLAGQRAHAPLVALKPLPAGQEAAARGTGSVWRRVGVGACASMGSCVTLRRACGRAPHGAVRMIPRGPPRMATVAAAKRGRVTTPANSHTVHAVLCALGALPVAHAVHAADGPPAEKVVPVQAAQRPLDKPWPLWGACLRPRRKVREWVCRHS